MLTSIEVKDVRRIEGLALEVETSEARIAHDLGATYAKLYALAGQAGLPPAGPAFAAYTDPELDPDHMHVVAGVPVASPPREPVEGATLRSFGGGRAVTTTFVGSYAGLGRAWRDVWAWVGEHGYAPSGTPFELYRVGPPDADEAHYETDIVIPVG